MTKIDKRLVPMYCYVCRDEAISSTFYATENGFDLVKCDGCGLLHLKHRPSDETLYQSHEVGQHAGEETIDTTGGFRDRKVRMYQKILKDLYGASDAVPNTWLDIGCGHGEFLVALDSYCDGRLKLAGLEPNKFKRLSCEKKGLDVRNFDLRDHNGAYDSRAILNVFSHLPDPPKILAEWKRLLNPGGELLIQTGDSSDLPAESQLRPLLLPDHLSFASERIVMDILTGLGFEEVRICKYPYVQRNLAAFCRETAKLICGRKTHLRAMLLPDILGKTDMYIRARMRST